MLYILELQNLVCCEYHQFETFVNITNLRRFEMALASMKQRCLDDITVYFGQSITEVKYRYCCKSLYD